MKKRRSPARTPPRRAYDFSAGERGKYAGRVRGAPRAIVLEPEIARLFPNSRAVNRALRLIAEIAQRSLQDKE